jgi:AraC-like DNA-binding protein
VGIPNRFKFFHQFRQFTGVTPDRYRASVRK